MNKDEIGAGLSYLKKKEKELLLILLENYKGEFTPIELAERLAVTNKTVIVFESLVNSKSCKAYKNFY